MKERDRFFAGKWMVCVRRKTEDITRFFEGADEEEGLSAMELIGCVLGAKVERDQSYDTIFVRVQTPEVDADFWQSPI